MYRHTTTLRRLFEVEGLLGGNIIELSSNQTFTVIRILPQYLFRFINSNFYLNYLGYVQFSISEPKITYYQFFH